MQTQSKPGTARCVTMASGRFAGSVLAKTSVDTNTAVDDVNKDNESDYFYLVINGILKLLDPIASDGTIRKCISVAKHCIDIVHSSTSPDTSPVTNDDEVIPNSGATSHMRKNTSIFEHDYVACNDVFVLIGDGTESLVLAYSSSQMKIDGHVTRLLNSLHVSGLDCDLFSCTRHGMTGKGCSFFR